MHPRIAELLQYLDRQRATLDAAIAAVPEAARTTRPAENRWSTAEVVEHLAEVERRIAGMIAKQISEAKARGLARESSTSSILAIIDSARISDRSTRLSSNMTPTGKVDMHDAIGQLDAARKDLTAATLQGDGYDLSALTAPHRAFGQLTMYEWIEFAGSHMARHAEQIREMA